MYDANILCNELCHYNNALYFSSGSCTGPLIDVLRNAISATSDGMFA